MLSPALRVLSAAMAVALTTSCSSSTGPAAPPPIRVLPPPTPAREATPARTEPQMPVAEALAGGQALAKIRPRRPNAHQPGSAAAFFAQNALDEVQVRSLLEAVTRACLEQRSPDAEPCKRLRVVHGDNDPVVEVLVEMAGEIADTSPRDSRTLGLLIRLEARGAWRARSAIELALERRMSEGLGACAPPTDAEIEVARAELADVRLIAPAGAPRAPTEAELGDLAYLHASVRYAAKEVGTTPEDQAAPPLPKGSSEPARREKLRAAMSAALLDGDIARHAEAAETYLTALGWPGPIRVAEDGDERWGGSGFSYALRDWARSAEILGRFELAEALRRRAAPGGGACGTSTPSVLAEQIEGVIRAAELREGCRPIVAERLFTVANDLRHAYGPERLARSGFDVTRLYRAALLDTGGAVDWAARVRAIPGYADTAGQGAVPRIVELAERGPTPRRVDALETLGRLLESHGLDPCRPSNMGIGSGSSNMEREVGSIMTDCKTRLDDKAVATVVSKIGVLASDTDPGVRESVARALGKTASPRARATLEKLARDGFELGGTVCTSSDGGPQTCEPNLPVRRAAKEGLKMLVEADRVRRQQNEASRKSP